MLPVNIEKAEYVISLSSQKNGLRSIMLLLREIEDQLLARQKLNKSFYQISQIIEQGYSKKMYTDNQSIKRIQYQIYQQDKDMDNLTHKQTLLKQELASFEDELSGLREYAEQRRNKKSKRERQYHQFYHVPILANEWKKKYIRARDKNSDAEERVSLVRSKVDSCQQEISSLSKSIADLQKHKEQLLQQSKGIQSQLAKDQELCFQLKEGHNFLTGFDHHQLITAQKAIEQFGEFVQSHSQDQISDLNQHFVKVFRLALFEYGEAEKLADKRWGQIQIPFNCMKCKMIQLGWPKLEKLDFVCDPCYQEHHHSSSLTMPEIKKKPGFKKMMKKMLTKQQVTAQ